MYIDPTGTIKPLPSFAKLMRKNPTPSESRLYWGLKNSKRIGKQQVKSQVIFGWYIIDIVIKSRCLAVEIDGNSHEGREEYDSYRDDYLRRNGLAVIRFSNHEVWDDLDGVIDKIISQPLREGFARLQCQANNERVSVQESRLRKMGYRRDTIQKMVVEIEKETPVEERLDQLPLVVKKCRVKMNGSRQRPRCVCGKPLATTWKMCKGCGLRIQWEDL
jgi:very-short-patch-repair endonuclease